MLVELVRPVIAAVGIYSFGYDLMSGDSKVDGANAVYDLRITPRGLRTPFGYLCLAKSQRRLEGNQSDGRTEKNSKSQCNHDTPPILKDMVSCIPSLSN
jgi:hypothetical protein